MQFLKFAVEDYYRHKQTIKHIIDNKCSVSRYGDGEFNIIKGVTQDKVTMYRWQKS